MYRRIVGYFSGTMSENSEERNQHITETTNMEGGGGGGETVDKTNLNIISELRDRIKGLEEELKVQNEECEAYKNKLHTLEKELKDLKAAHIKECENYKKSLQILEQQLKTIKATQVEESEAYKMKINILEKELTDLKGTYAEECENYKNKLQILEKELSSMNTAQTEECENYKRKCERQEKEITELKSTQIEESENYNKKVSLLEKELRDLKENSALPSTNTVSTGVGDEILINSTSDNNENKEESDTANLGKLTYENSELRDELTKTGELLKDKTNLCASQEKQNLALTNQVASLKEVVAITKDLLNIRNMEVQHLQSDVESMEGKISEERIRHNTMIEKMDEAVKLNSDLKNEYETQLKIFKDLKEKYEEKVDLLTKENEKLEKQVSQSKTEKTDFEELLSDGSPMTEGTVSQSQQPASSTTEEKQTDGCVVIEEISSE